jgi:hypothetical protein
MARKNTAAATGSRTLVNPRRSARVYDVAGHSIEAGGRLTVDEIDAVGQRAIDLGYLFVKSDPTPPAEPLPDPSPME